MHDQDTSITAILSNGGTLVPDEVVPRLLGRLRQMAGMVLRHSPQHPELEPAGLISELYTELKDYYGALNGVQRRPADRHEFLAFSATLMRRIVVRELRRRFAAKRSSEGPEVRLHLVRSLADREEIDLPTLLSLDSALDRLGESEPRLQSVVELRFFGGYSIEETADALGVSPITVKRAWRTALCRLKADLAGLSLNSTPWAKKTAPANGPAPGRPALDLNRPLLLPAEQLPRLEGMRLDGYLVGRRIGGGGSSEVFRARRVEDSEGAGERFVIKVIRPELVDNGECVEMLRRELDSRRLGLPDVAWVIDHGVSPCGRPFLVSHYVDGETIIDHCRLRRHGLRRRLLVFDHLCKIVQRLHQLDTVHCDIKPANVLVTRLGLVRLLDFGIARHAWRLAAPRRGLGWLTPAYSCPEQRRGEPPTPAWDLYALGAILHELLTGSRPGRKPLSIRALSDAILDSPAAHLQFGEQWRGEGPVESDGDRDTSSLRRDRRARVAHVLAPALARALHPRALERGDIDQFRATLREAERACIP